MESSNGLVSVDWLQDSRKDEKLAPKAWHLKSWRHGALK